MQALDVMLEVAGLLFTSVQLTWAVLVVATPGLAVLLQVNVATAPGAMFVRLPVTEVGEQSLPSSTNVQVSVVGPLLVTVML